MSPTTSGRQLASEVIIAAAGGGKTTRIVDRALTNTCQRAVLITYTNNNVAVIKKAIYGRATSLPAHLEVATWYSFLLHDMARPYQRSVLDRRIDGFVWEPGQSTQGIPKSNKSAYYFAGNSIYSDKIADFICAANEATKGLVIERLEQRFDHIYIDEVQDLSGWDLDIVELILKSRLKLTLVGDHRQATFSTNLSPKNKRYRGPKIISKFEEWKKEGLLAIKRETETHRCHQKIADLADRFFPDDPPTVSLNKCDTGHDGVFAISRSDVEVYVRKFQPQVLRYSKSTDCAGLDAMNFGLSKGMTFDRVLIFPHGKGITWLKTGLLSHVEKSAAEMYVGSTRARHSLAFVIDHDIKVPGISRFTTASET